MAKDKTMYVCDQCGQESSGWIGKCPACGAWNSFKQIRVSAQPEKASVLHPESATAANVKRLRNIESRREPRITTGDDELNRVLGGGLVPGSLVLLGGEPGIGKSTLLLQTVMKMKGRTLYVSGEESEHQLKMRADPISWPSFSAVNSIVFG